MYKQCLCLFLEGDAGRPGNPGKLGLKGRLGIVGTARFEPQRPLTTETNIIHTHTHTQREREREVREWG